MFKGVFLTVLVVWLVIGLLLALVMGRRGHNPFGWFLVGMALGPLAFVLALTSFRQDETEPKTLGGSTAAATGPVDVLVGYDGSPEAVAAVDAVVALLGPRLGRLTVTTVIPFGAGPREEQSAEAALNALLTRTTHPAESCEVLRGLPADALNRRAVEGGYQLIVVGTRGTGIATAVFGSTATGLARASKLPVLMVGAEAAGAAG